MLYHEDLFWSPAPMSGESQIPVTQVPRGPTHTLLSSVVTHTLLCIHRHSNTFKNLQLAQMALLYLYFFYKISFLKYPLVKLPWYLEDNIECSHLTIFLW